MQGAAEGQGDTERAGIKIRNQNSEHPSSRESISRYNGVRRTAVFNPETLDAPSL